jgi:hypothetical protein
MANTLELQDLYRETLVRDIMEKTRSCGLVWSHEGGSQFSAVMIQDFPGTVPDVEWTFYVTKSQIGNLSYKYSLDVKKNGYTHVTLESGPLVYTARDSMVKELYEVVEAITLQTDSKIRETIRFIQQVPDCQTGPTVGYEWVAES